MYHGATYDDIKELYYDICQLDVMSGIEIDKAKKEFIINNGKELDKLREKYDEFVREYEENEEGELVRGKCHNSFLIFLSKRDITILTRNIIVNVTPRWIICKRLSMDLKLKIPIRRIGYLLYLY